MNRYNQPQSSQFMNTYVAPPLEIMQQALAQKQSQYDHVKEYTRQFNDNLTGLEVTGNSAANYLSGVQDKFGKVLEELKGQDLLDPTNQKKLDAVVNEISNDKQLKTHLAVNSKVKEWKENYDNLVKENGINDANVWKYKDALTKYGETGIADPILGETSINKAADRFKEFSSFYDQLHASGGDVVNFLKGSENGRSSAIAYNSSVEGISNQDVHNQMERVIDMARNTPAGQEVLREYEMLMHRNGQDVTNDGAMRYLKQNVLNAGLGKVYSKTSNNLSVALNKDRDEKQESVFPILTAKINGPSSSTSNVAEYDDNGMLVLKDGSLTAKLGASLEAMMELPMSEWFDKIPEVYKNAKGADQREFVATTAAHKLAAAANKMTDKELAEHQSRPIQFKAQTLSKDDSERLNRQLLSGGMGNFLNFGAYDPTSGKTTDAKSALIKILGDQGISADESNLLEVMSKAHIKPEIISKVNSNNPMSPLVYQISVGGLPLYIDPTQGNRELILDMHERGNITEKDIHNYMDAKLHHYKYQTDEINENGKKGLLVNYVVEENLDGQKGTRTESKFVPLPE
jgi:hypothetical protein